MSAHCRQFVCAEDGCQNMIHLHHDVESRLRRTHETFFCPAGHRNFFPGKTEEEKKIARLQRDVERWRERWNDEYDAREEWKLHAKTCPFECGYRVPRKSSPGSIAATLSFHLIEEHGAHISADSITAAEEAEAARA